MNYFLSTSEPLFEAVANVVASMIPSNRPATASERNDLATFLTLLTGCESKSARLLALGLAYRKAGMVPHNSLGLIRSSLYDEGRLVFVQDLMTLSQMIADSRTSNAQMIKHFGLLLGVSAEAVLQIVKSANAQPVLRRK